MLCRTCRYCRGIWVIVRESLEEYKVHCARCGTFRTVRQVRYCKHYRPSIRKIIRQIWLKLIGTI